MERVKFAGRRLGRQKPKIAPHKDASVLHFGDYVDRDWEKWMRSKPRRGELLLTRSPTPMPPLRQYRDWWPFISAQLPNGPGMMLNDQLGDCTVAAVGHAIQILTGVDGKVVTATNAQVQTMYEASGYVPGDPSTDQGWLIQSALEYWRTNGLAGHTIEGYVAIDPANDLHIDLALEIFGFVNPGIYLPLSAQSQNLLFSVPSTGLSGDGAPGSWGGHSFIIHKRCSVPVYRRSGITWGIPEWHITPNAWAAYVDECWTAYSTDSLRGAKSFSGFDQAQMMADMQAVALAKHK